jgi:alginate O-acetyltransferase complex protein AlgI
LLTGLWHGVTATYILWGLAHGILMALESLFLGSWLRAAFRPIRHVYAISAILMTWLIFRSPTPEFAAAFMSRLAGNVDGIVALPFSQTAPLPFLEPSFWLAFIFGTLFALPVKPFFEEKLSRFTNRAYTVKLPLLVFQDLVLLLLFLLSVGAMASSKFLPGIYGSF